MINSEIIEFLKSTSPFFTSSTNGLYHWRTVERNGLYLSDFTGADKSVVSYFSYFHDSMRVNEGVDPRHGPRATALLKKNRSLIKLNDDQFKILCSACSGHTYGRRTKCPTLATCWDADRLDIIRVGIVRDPKYFFSDEAKRIIVECDDDALHQFSDVKNI